MFKAQRYLDTFVSWHKSHLGMWLHVMSTCQSELNKHDDIFHSRRSELTRSSPVQEHDSDATCWAGLVGQVGEKVYVES
jgi:hypothetical protein